jgi:YkoY family integral membrane protein
MTDFISSIQNNWQQIVAHPAASISIVLNLILIESLLSVDNAAVIATMVRDLPKEQRAKALKYGIWGAYLFRGIAMLFVSVLIKIWWLKPLGGLYLIYLAVHYFISNKTEATADDTIDKQSNWFYKISVGTIGTFWATVVLVEIMDMAFSIDNVFAAVAFTPNILLVCFGVFIGILAMRFVAQYFVKLIDKYAFLESAAFIVIGILGLKLSLSLFEHFYPVHAFSKFLSSHEADLGLSIITVLVFFVPIITSALFNFPKKENNKA